MKGESWTGFGWVDEAADFKEAVMKDYSTEHVFDVEIFEDGVGASAEEPAPAEDEVPAGDEVGALARKLMERAKAYGAEVPWFAAKEAARDALSDSLVVVKHEVVAVPEATTGPQTVMITIKEKTNEVTLLPGEVMYGYKQAEAYATFVAGAPSRYSDASGEMKPITEGTLHKAWAQALKTGLVTPISPAAAPPEHYYVWKREKKSGKVVQVAIPPGHSVWTAGKKPVEPLGVCLGRFAVFDAEGKWTHLCLDYGTELLDASDYQDDGWDEAHKAGNLTMVPVHVGPVLELPDLNDAATSIFNGPEIAQVYFAGPTGAWSQKAKAQVIPKVKSDGTLVGYSVHLTEVKVPQDLPGNTELPEFGQADTMTSKIWSVSLSLPLTLSKDEAREQMRVFLAGEEAKMVKGGYRRTSKWKLALTGMSSAAELKFQAMVEPGDVMGSLSLSFWPTPKGHKKDSYPEVGASLTLENLEELPVDSVVKFSNEYEDAQFKKEASGSWYQLNPDGSTTGLKAYFTEHNIKWVTLVSKPKPKLKPMSGTFVNTYGITYGTATSNSPLFGNNNLA